MSTGRFQLISGGWKGAAAVSTESLHFLTQEYSQGYIVHHISKITHSSGPGSHLWGGGEVEFKDRWSGRPAWGSCLISQGLPRGADAGWGMAESHPCLEWGQHWIQSGLVPGVLGVPADHQLWLGAKAGYQERCWQEEGMHMWVASVCCSGGKGFMLEEGAERGQIAGPVCATGLRACKQVGPRSRKAEETRNEPVLAQHIPG